mgnify:CR=1 FL=1
MPTMIFESPDGKSRKEVAADAGKSVLDIAHANGIEIEGACEGSMACSTCHVVIDPAFYTQLPEPSLEEEDMLDLTYFLRPTSRLGCQITLTDDLDGLVVRLPKGTTNMMGL